mgnify:FL=1
MSREDYEEKKRQDIASFVQDGKVDWQRWKALVGNEGSYNEKIESGVINHLLEIGILSFEPEENHRVADSGGLNLNPKIHVCQTYFTRRDQARDYAKVLFSGALYEVRIEKLSDIEKVTR